MKYLKFRINNVYVSHDVAQFVCCRSTKPYKPIKSSMEMKQLRFSLPLDKNKLLQNLKGNMEAYILVLPCSTTFMYSVELMFDCV